MGYVDTHWVEHKELELEEYWSSLRALEVDNSFLEVKLYLEQGENSPEHA